MLNIPYNTPFMWSAIWADDFINLISYFDNLNFDNIELSEYQLNDKEKCYSVILDGIIKIQYTHYKFWPFPRKVIGNDLLDNNIDKYTLEVFKERTKRMFESKESPTFLILGNMHNVPGYNLRFDTYNLQNLIRICEIKTRYKICIITHSRELLNYASDRVKIIIDDHPKNLGYWGTEQFANLYKEQIVEFSNE